MLSSGIFFSTLFLLPTFLPSTISTPYIGVILGDFVNLGCDPGWNDLGNGYCYQVVTSKQVSRKNANFDCGTTFSSLVTVNSAGDMVSVFICSFVCLFVRLLFVCNGNKPKNHVHRFHRNCKYNLHMMKLKIGWIKINIALKVQKKCQRKIKTIQAWRKIRLPTQSLNDVMSPLICDGFFEKKVLPET